MNTARVCAVVGVGPGLGAAYARRFHRAGYAVALLARSTRETASLAAELGGAALAYACDITDEAAVNDTFAKIQADLGPVDVLIYNAGSGVWGTVETVSREGFEQAWRTNALGLFFASRAVIPAMKSKAAGAIVITGATASRRGAPATTAFAPAKAAQRSLAESMARHLWPLGIHVSLIIVDGVVDLAATRVRMPDKPDSFFVSPADVAATAEWLALQPSSAWTFEVEARPFAEKW
jgi:NAD(P)-dependent dehydrogenase (short-subunit alcohol dehydrogenase family)